jgi:hypothetical protein
MLCGVVWRNDDACASDKSNHSQPPHRSFSRARSCCVVSLIRQVQDKPRPLVYCRRHLINLTNTWLNASPSTPSTASPNSHPLLNLLAVSLKLKHAVYLAPCFPEIMLQINLLLNSFALRHCKAFFLSLSCCTCILKLNRPTRFEGWLILLQVTLSLQEKKLKSAVVSDIML